MSLKKFYPGKRITSFGSIPFCAVPALLCIIILSCSTLNSERESWEGFRDGTLRVFVRYNYIGGIDGTINRDANEILLDTGRIRAEAILMSFMRVHVAGFERTSACQRLLTGILSGGTIRRKFCRDDFCAASIDFDVNDFLKAAE